MKIVIIDNLEYFNLNALSALLKIIEEPPQNTYFFLINNSESKLLKTIKSRCLEFKVFFSYEKNGLFGVYSGKEKLFAIRFY